MMRILFTALFSLALIGSGAAVAAPADQPTPARNYSTAEHALGSDGSFLLAQYNRGRVCCKRGWRDWWTRSYRTCRRQGGYVVRDRQCRRGYDDIGFRRVCCKRGYRDWWSTNRQCRRSGGYIVANWQCRNG